MIIKRIKRSLVMLMLLCVVACSGCSSNDVSSQQMNYYLPAEAKNVLHEGTWIAWPHTYTYDEDNYRQLISAENSWVDIVDALHTGETVHILSYNEAIKERLTELLVEKGVDMGKIDIVIAEYDDVWLRDSGAIFVYDKQNQLHALDFGFNGWGAKEGIVYAKDDLVAQKIANAKSIPLVSIPEFVLEGGSVEVDGAKTFMGTKSSIVNENRNPGMSLKTAENYLRKYLGVSNFIWLEGVSGEDDTDMHIDGTARFVDENTIIAVTKKGFMEQYDGAKESDWEILINAKNAEGKPYKIVELPSTVNPIGNTGFRDSYVNYYVGNEVVLCPIYNDPSDQEALNILAELYPDKKVVPIDSVKLFEVDGMIHCITQQQPVKLKQ